MPKSTKYGTKHPFVEQIQICSNEGPRPFPRRDNYEIEKIHWRNFKIFSWTAGSIHVSTKLGKKHPWVKGIQVCSTEGPLLLPRGDNYEIAKIHWRNKKILYFQEPLGQFQPNLAQGILGWGTEHFRNKEHSILKKEIGFLLSKSS